MPFDLGIEANDATKMEVPGAGLDTPTLEKNIELRKGSMAPQDLESSDDEESVPTVEELATLRKVHAPIKWVIYTVAFVELCERFSYYGSATLFTNFIQQPLPEGSTTGNDPHPDGQPGALGQGQRASTGLGTFNRFWAYCMPMVGGYIADTYWGRFKTIQWSILIAIIGHILLIVSALPPVIKNPDGALGCFSVGLIAFGAGVGGFKSNISPLIAEQQTVKKPYTKTLASGERVIVDPATTTQRIYMYFYFMINVGAIIGQVTMVYTERYIGFWLAFTLPTIMFAICPLVLWLCKNKYYHAPPTGSVLGKFCHLYAFALKGKVSINPVTTYKNITARSFWEDVKPSRVQNKPSWMTFDDAWVDEVQRAVRACTVFLLFPLYWLAYNQIDNNLTSQSATMDLHGVPNDLINNLDPLSIIILIPILDRGVYPVLRKLNIRFSRLKRITAGFLIAALGMVVAAVIQSQIYAKGACGKYMATCDTTAPINVWVQAPVFILIGLSEILASVTGLEYAYSNAPANMRSLVMGFYLFTSAISAALTQAFVGLSADPLLVWLYGSVAIIAGIGGVMFWVFFRGWDKDEEKMNLLPESEWIGANQPTGSKTVDEEEGPTSAPTPVTPTLDEKAEEKKTAA
ncbi:putative oligopeptide transporter [Phaeomoniella chlamydospora]|uniref:Putative oligopeptide transporter n=1 Tax=Phaeomoniella chlamydospora TaxID=158046 RepID=A0A0G2EZL5_PHACM|nr:putative oligopeptide transporter [Phaeomoniella chlamydospora]